MAYNFSDLTTEQQMIAEAKKFVNSKQRELTQAQYDQLTTEEKNNGTVYFITDGEGEDIYATKTYVDTGLNGKVDTESGKGLSTNDYTDTDKAKVNGAIQSIEKGVANGVASLDSNGKVPSEQINLPQTTQIKSTKLKSVPKVSECFNKKTWFGLSSFYGDCTWSDGENIYYSDNSTQYVLDKSTSTWSQKIWNGLSSFIGYCIWTDEENIYYSDNSTQYVLDKSTSTWSQKTWNGLSSFIGYRIWTDGENIYYSNSSAQYVLDKSTSTWSQKIWNGLTSFSGNYIWTDGKNIYCSDIYAQFVLDIPTKFL